MGALCILHALGPDETLQSSMKSSSHRRALVSPGTAHIEFDKLDVFIHCFIVKGIMVMKLTNGNSILCARKSINLAPNILEDTE